MRLLEAGTPQFVVLSNFVQFWFQPSLQLQQREISLTGMRVTPYYADKNLVQLAAI